MSGTETIITYFTNRERLCWHMTRTHLSTTYIYPPDIAALTPVKGSVSDENYKVLKVRDYC